MNTRTLNGWLTFSLERLATGAIPVDGSHGLPDAQRRRAAAEREAQLAVPAPRRVGKISFVRGLY